MSANNGFPELGGYVTSTKSFYGKNNIEHVNGLFSQQIFGPKKSYCCSCGNLNSFIYAGMRCNKCGVYCDTNELRYTQFGKIKLIFPVIKPSRINEVVKILGKEAKVLLNPIRSEVNVVNKKYLAIKIDKTELKIVNSLEENVKNFLIIPFRITGVFSLYLALKFCKTYFNNPQAIEILDKEYMIREIKVLPPNLRIVSFDASKNEIRTPEINRFYTTIIKLNKNNYPLLENLPTDEQDWIEMIRENLKSRIFDQDIVDSSIIHYDQQASIYQYYVNTIYDHVYSELSGKQGLIRSSILGRNIEFSARSVVVVDPSLPAYQIKVSKKILKKLWTPYFIYYLTNIRGLDYSYCFESLMLKDYNNPDYNKYFEEFLEWFCEEYHANTDC